MDIKVFNDASKAISNYAACLGPTGDKMARLAKVCDDHEKIARAYSKLLSEMEKDITKSGGELTKDQLKQLEKAHKEFRDTDIYVQLKLMAGYCETQMDYWDKAYKADDRLPS